jgi:hypothetical protein
MLRDPLQQLSRHEPDIAVLVEQPQRDVEQPRLLLGRDAQQQADLVVRADVLGERLVDLAALQGAEALRAQAVVEVG